MRSTYDFDYAFGLIVKRIMKRESQKIAGNSPYQSDEEMTLGAWYSPDLVEELWVWYKEAGFTEITLFPTNEQTEEYLVSALALCKKYGIKAHVFMDNEQTVFGKTWRQILSGYEDTVTGFDICDEPLGYRQYSSLDRMDIADIQSGVDFVIKNFPDKQFTVTLWPNYACGEQLAMPEGAGYAEYVKKYCEDILAPLPKGVKRWLGTDFYPYYTNRFNGGILNNLEVLQYYATQYGAELYLYVQVMDSKTLNWRYPNEDELALQYNIALAYGVKNIQVFCYQEPKELLRGEFGYKDGKAMITDGYTPKYDEKGELLPRVYERTQSYFDVQKINNHLKNLAKAYMEFTWQGVLTVKGSLRSERDDFSSLIRTLPAYEGIVRCMTEENLIIGCFKDKAGKDGYMLTNYSDPTDFRNSFVEITFQGAEKAIVYRGGECFTVALERGMYAVELSGGEGVFVIPFNK